MDLMAGYEGLDFETWIVFDQMAEEMSERLNCWHSQGISD